MTIFQGSELFFTLTDPEELLNLTVLLKPHKASDTQFINNPYIDCGHKRTSFINNRTVDVHCDVREGVQEILIYGDGIRTICGFNVNGGERCKVMSRGGDGGR